MRVSAVKHGESQLCTVSKVGEFVQEAFELEARKGSRELRDLVTCFVVIESEDLRLVKAKRGSV